MPEEKPHKYVFDVPIKIDILLPGQIVSAGQAGKMTRELKRATAEVHAPEGFVDIVQRISKKELVLPVPLAIQLCLEIMGRLGMIVEKGSKPAGPTGLVS